MCVENYIAVFVDGLSLDSPVTRYSIDSSVNQIYPKDESAPKDFLFPHMPQKKQVSPTRILQTRHTRHWGSQSPGLSWSLQHSWQRSWPLTPGCQYPLAAAATRMPPAVAKCPRGWAGGQNGPCGESPVLPLPQKVCCFPVTGEKTPGTRNRKELSCSRSLRAGSPPPLAGAPPT